MSLDGVEIALARTKPRSVIRDSSEFLFPAGSCLCESCRGESGGNRGVLSVVEAVLKKSWQVLETPFADELKIRRVIKIPIAKI